MGTKVALLVVYNHRYDKNIPIIDELYRGKFTYVYHLVPFYDGDKDNVIAVYDNSYYFQNYIAQAYQHIRHLGFTHFFVVADDMILNPEINEFNLWERIGIGADDCFITRLSILQQRRNFWPWIINALKYKRKQPGVEIMNILPSVDVAKERFRLHGIPTHKIPHKRIFTKDLKSFWGYIVRNIPFTLELDYPLLGGYSDIFIVTAKEIDKFCQYCGAFAATKLFVEIAIPTSMVLTADIIKLNEDVKLKEGDMWFKEVEEFCNRYDYDLQKLLAEFPHGKLFVHPIKLSKWKSNKHLIR